MPGPPSLAALTSIKPEASVASLQKSMLVWALATALGRKKTFGQGTIGCLLWWSNARNEQCSHWPMTPGVSRPLTLPGRAFVEAITPTTLTTIPTNKNPLPCGEGAILCRCRPKTASLILRSAWRMPRPCPTCGSKNPIRCRTRRGYGRNCLRAPWSGRSRRSRNGCRG